MNKLVNSVDNQVFFVETRGRKEAEYAHKKKSPTLPYDKFGSIVSSLVSGSKSQINQENQTLLRKFSLNSSCIPVIHHLSCHMTVQTE